MSYPTWFEDKLEQIDRARNKVVYGAAALPPAIFVAQQIEAFRQIKHPGVKKLMKERCGDSLVDFNEHLADVTRALERKGLANASCQLKVLDAYEAAVRRRSCEEPDPTLGEIRAEFLRRNDASLLPKGFSLRKMVVKTFELPLAKAKLGRPVIRNSPR